MQEMVHKELLKLLDVEIIYLIFDSAWVSLMQIAPKKGDIMMVSNENNELTTTRTRTVTRWQVCIDYHKLNDANRKDHFRLPFID